VDRSFVAPSVSAPQLAVLLERSLEVWGVGGRAMVDSDVFPVRLDLQGGQRFAIEPAGAGEQPIRWWLLWLGGYAGATETATSSATATTTITATATAAGDALDVDARAGRAVARGGLAASRATHGAAASADGGARASTVIRRKPCASVAGLLRTLRETLGVTGQSRIRVGASDA